jgi:transposase
LCDKGYSYARCRAEVRVRGIKAVIPERSDQIRNRKAKGRKGGCPCKFDPQQYRDRNLIERCILRLKQFRSFATRYEKLADQYWAVVIIASIFVWIN